MDELRGLYRERAYLIAYLAARYPSAMGTDPGEPDWPVVYITTPEGQLSWHISQDDLHLLDHVPREGAPEWDGHTTVEKYRRLATLTKRQRALRDHEPL